MPKTVLGIFRNRENAEDAIMALEDNGYQAEDISIIMKDSGEARELEHNTGTHVADGAVGGATTGAVVGGLAGLLVGIGALAIPGVGAFLIGGPIAAALGLTGAAATTVSGAATGALAGGIIGALVGLGVPEDEARVYENEIREGAILIAVPVRAGYEGQPVDILEEYGAEQVRTVGMGDEARRPMTRTTRADMLDEDEEVEPRIQRTDMPEHTYSSAGAKGGRTKGWFREDEPEEPTTRTHTRRRRLRR